MSEAVSDASSTQGVLCVVEEGTRQGTQEEGAIDTVTKVYPHLRLNS